MNILVDIGHPGHVHLYKHFIREMKNKDYKVIVTVKNIESAITLLKNYGIAYINIGKKKDSLFNKAINQILYNYKLYRIIKKEKINIGVGTSISLAHVTKLTQIKSFFLEDDDDKVIPFSVNYGHPFVSHLLSPITLNGKQKRQDIIYHHSYHELAYLHPNYFSPDPKILKELNLSKYEPFFILRFNVFKAHHDIGIKGLDSEQKKKLIKLLEPHGKVFITTEREIDPVLKKYQMPVSPEKIHSLLYYATMFLGDSQTMTSEAAVLGTPALKCNSFAGKLSVPNELENKYGLCYSFQPHEFDKMLEKVKILLSKNNLTEEWNEKRRKMLRDKIDLTSFLFWLIENYPESARIMKENPDYQFNFK